MKHYCYLLAVVGWLCAQPLRAIETYNVEDAAKKGLIRLSIRSRGGFSGKVMSMTICNLQKDSLVLTVEPGRRLDSEDNTLQDILVTRSERFKMAGGQKSTYGIYGMCCQLHNHAPDSNAVYTVGHMADTNLVKLASFINKYRYYNEYAAQCAVWVVSDGQLLASVSSRNDNITDNLRECVAGITGESVPYYSIVYKAKKPGQLIGEMDHIEGKLRYTLNTAGNVLVGIYNSDGRMVQLVKDAKQEQGKYSLFYTFNTTNLPPGTYSLRLLVDGKPGREEKIVF